jgi:hypothetical protein
MNLHHWGPWVGTAELAAGIYSLDSIDQDAILAVGVLGQCGWIWSAHNQIILYNQELTIFRSLSANSLFNVNDYRRPLAVIFENNIDLLTERQMKILTSRCW